jgi:hypothetical protein
MLLQFKQPVWRERWASKGGHEPNHARRGGSKAEVPACWHGSPAFALRTRWRRTCRAITALTSHLPTVLRCHPPTPPSPVIHCLPLPSPKYLLLVCLVCHISTAGRNRTSLALKYLSPVTTSPQLLPTFGQAGSGKGGGQQGRAMATKVICFLVLASLLLAVAFPVVRSLR